MNAPRATDEAAIQFLIGSPVAVSATEAARVPPPGPRAPAHDAFTRLLRRLEPDPAVLWDEVRPLLDPTDGVLVIDDSTLDKPRAKHIELVSRHWSGNHRAVVSGINLVTLLWSDGDRLYPTDYRLDMGEDARRMFAELSWGIEEYHRGRKPFTGVERCQARAARSQRNHIGFALRAFVRLEHHRFTTGVSWFAAKMGVIREAVRAYLANPTYTLPKGATA